MLKNTTKKTIKKTDYKQILVSNLENAIFMLTMKIDFDTQEAELKPTPEEKAKLLMSVDAMKVQLEGNKKYLEFILSK